MHSLWSYISFNKKTGTTFTAASFCILHPGSVPKFEDVLRWPKQVRESAQTINAACTPNCSLGNSGCESALGFILWQGWKGAIIWCGDGRRGYSYWSRRKSVVQSWMVTIYCLPYYWLRLTNSWCSGGSFSYVQLIFLSLKDLSFLRYPHVLL